MSPEQAEGRAVDHRSDIFSLGIVLYEMATGERPFQGENATSVLSSILRDTPRSVTELRPELPKELGKIVRRALAKDREGGDEVQVGDNGAVGVDWDGSVYFTKSNIDGGPPGIWRIPVGGEEEVRVLESVSFIDWSVFRRGICYLNCEAKPGTAIELYDFSTGEISQVAVLQDPPSPLGLSVSPDGRWILYLKDESAADIMLVENFR